MTGENTFEANLSIICNMQNQAPLCSIFSERKILPEERSNLIRTYEAKIFSLPANTASEPSYVELSAMYRAVQNMEGFMHAYGRIWQELVDDDRSSLWFRGVHKTTHRLIPTLYRIKNGQDRAYSTNSLRNIMEDMVDAFRVRAYNAPEIKQGGNDSYIGTLASMQHYGLETNLLDWSRHIFSSLYFTLEKYVDEPEKKPDAGIENARVYILNPMRMNQAFSKMKGQDPAASAHYGIPSVFNDKKELFHYLPFSDAGTASGTQKDGHQIDYPIALYTPFLNARIKAQAGCFTIFSLDTDYVDDPKGEGRDYTGYDLLHLQEEYKNYCQQNCPNEYKPFIGYIDINRDHLSAFARELRSMGITRENVYPELENITKGIKAEIRRVYG